MAKIKEDFIHFRVSVTWNETIMCVISIKQLVMASMYCYWCNHFVTQISYKIQSLNFTSFYFILYYFCSIYHSNLFISIHPSIYSSIHVMLLFFIDLNLIGWKCFYHWTMSLAQFVFYYFFCILYSVESWLLCVICSAMEFNKKNPEWLFYIYYITQLYDFIVYLCVSKEICDILTIDTVNTWRWFLCICMCDFFEMRF